MITGSYLLILIYSNVMMITEKYPDITECMLHVNRIGEEAKVTMWDNMNGSNPIPRVAIAFCVQGVAAQ